MLKRIDLDVIWICGRRVSGRDLESYFVNFPAPTLTPAVSNWIPHLQSTYRNLENAKPHEPSLNESAGAQN